MFPHGFAPLSGRPWPRITRAFAVVAEIDSTIALGLSQLVVVGGLMSFNTDRDEIGRQIGNCAAQILKGVKLGDLPVVQSSKFVFVIGLGTAKSARPDDTVRAARTYRRVDRIRLAMSAFGT
jgi:ABC transporter substrate binding protein